MIYPDILVIKGKAATLKLSKADSIVIGCLGMIPDGLVSVIQII
jgi:hypothetical protein